MPYADKDKRLACNRECIKRHYQRNKAELNKKRALRQKFADEWLRLRMMLIDYCE